MLKRDFFILLLIIVIIIGIYFAYHITQQNFLAGNESLTMIEKNSALSEQSIKENVPTITVGATTLRLELADTAEERTLGLSGRTSLPQDTGLLFIFEEAGRWGFWMKDMHFSIDIIWLDENYKVVGLKENAKPESYPETFMPQAPAKYVLETNVNFIKNNNIQYGTIMALTNM
ncbi:DUF192 domain-containing protein [Candidatus Parcubacteria bacterium]|nr:DUF192 domain-containing protein [Candidatus Parcubacteria bacterium]